MPIHTYCLELIHFTASKLTRMEKEYLNASLKMNFARLAKKALD